MPKALKKKSVKAKSTVAKKKVAPKKHAKPSVKAKTKTEKEPSFMWKLLKQKEAERKQISEGTKSLPLGFRPANSMPHNSRPMPFSKFQGPRRKVG